MRNCRWGNEIGNDAVDVTADDHRPGPVPDCLAGVVLLQ